MKDLLRIGTKIKLARVGRLVTQRELANRIEVSQGFLSQLECGERNPSKELIDEIQRALNCDFESDDW
jgi:transcriptional regulator with XRE-family HTH domain